MGKLWNPESFTVDDAMLKPMPDTAPNLLTQDDLAAQVPNVTTLANGVRVATANWPGYAASIGLFVDAGSRYETAHNQGVSHLLEKMHCKSSANLSKVRTAYEIELMGASIMVQRSRETMVYGAEVLQEKAEDLCYVLLESTMEPSFTAAEVKAAKSLIATVETKALEDDAQTQVFEAFHLAAFGGSDLGQPQFASPMALSNLSGDSMRDFMAEHWTGSSVVLSGAGADHDMLVKFAEDYLGDLPAGKGAKEGRAMAAYTGGSEVIAAQTGVTHLAVGFKGVG